MQVRRNKKLIIFSTILIICWLIAVPIRIVVGEYGLKYYNLEKKGMEVKARVLSVRPQDHRSVLYLYTVQGIEYKGIGRADFGNPDFDSIKPGMELRAFYLPSSPEISCLGLPQEHLINDLIPFSLFLVLVGIVLSIKFRSWKNRK